MSNFRTRAREIKAAGEAERGNFEPNGAPLRLYNYWLSNSESTKADRIKTGSRRENFCHFWRVVVIWAPLLFGFKIVERVLTSKVGAVATGLAGLVALVWACVTSESLLSLVLLILAVFAGVAALVGAVLGIIYLFKRYWNRDWNETASKIILGLFLVSSVSLLSFMLVLAVITEGWIILAYVFGGLAALAGVAYGLATLSEYLSGRRAVEREKQRERISMMTDEEYATYRAPKHRKPSKIKAFFSGLADFLILSAQIVRVKKWKICPMVTIDTPVQ